MVPTIFWGRNLTGATCLRAVTPLNGLLEELTKATLGEGKRIIVSCYENNFAFTKGDKSLLITN